LGKKIAPLYFWNNFVKVHHILIIIGTHFWLLAAFGRRKWRAKSGA